MPDEIVVFAEPVVKHHPKEWDRWEVELPELGLVAYEETKQAATDKLIKLFRSFVQVHRSKCTLEQWLTKAGVTWGYVSDFPGVKSRFRG